MCFFTWVLKLIQLEKDIMIYGEGVMLKKYLGDSMELFVEGKSFFEEHVDDDIVIGEDLDSRDIYSFKITQR
jgi:hypothetical protein